MSYHPQRNCPECGYGSGGHHQSCPERPDEPEEDVESDKNDETDETLDEQTPAVETLAMHPCRSCGMDLPCHTHERAGPVCRACIPF